MSDQTINQPRVSLKDLNTRMDKLGRTIDQLEKLAYRYQRLSYEINQIDVLAFEIRQKFDKAKKACQRIILQNEG